MRKMKEKGKGKKEKEAWRLGSLEAWLFDNFLTSKCPSLSLKPTRGKAFGFTVAEVLWTLVIISVVALLTVPPLITWKDKQVAVAGLQKSYSMLAQLVQRSEVDNGFVDNWGFSYTPYDHTDTNLTFLSAYIIPYLRVAKTCSSNQGCWAKTKKPNGDDFVATPETDGHFIKYVLSDGSVLAFIFRTAAPNPCIEILVDINGTKKPNTMGKDVFDFIITNKNGYSGFASNLKVGGIYPVGTGSTSVLTTDSTLGCSVAVTGSVAGSYCGAKIVNDGYQLQSDYPWK